MLVVLSGCGDGASIPSCDSAQIDPTHRKEGTCRRNKQVLVVVNPQHTLKLRDVSVRLTAPPALDEHTYRRAGTVVYTVPLQVGSHLYVEHLRLERAIRGVAPPVFVQQPPIAAGATRDGSVVFAFGRTDLRAVAPGQLLLLATSFADAAKSKTAERLGVIRFYN